MIKTEHLSAGYYQKAVIHNISFTVEQGKMIGLLGRNGCGKTTLFRCMNGLLKPLSGRVFLNGQNIASLNQTQIARLAALVPQGAATVFALQVIDMILLGSSCHLKAWQAPAAPEIAAAEKLAAEIGICHLLDKKFPELSGGEQQLVLIARALMQNTPILFLDEPTAHLDFTNQHLVMNLVRELVDRRNLTAVVTAHDPNLVLNYCDEVLTIKDGTLFAQGSVEQVLTQQTLRALYGESISLEQTASGKFAIPQGGRK